MARELIYDMTKEQYRAEREARGTQAEVAKLLRVTREVIARRETGAKITTEAALAIQALPAREPPKKGGRPKK